MTRKEFCSLIRMRYVPHYAWPRFEPNEIWNYFRLGILSAVRKVKNGSQYEKQFVRINTVVQQKIYRTLTSLTKVEPYVIGISSYPSELTAAETAACIHLALWRKIPGLRWMWVTSSFDPYKDKKEDAPHLVILRNVIADKERCYKVRDILEAYPKALRIVVLSGVSAFEYFDDYIHFPLSGAINIIGVKDRVTPVYLKPVQDYNIPTLIPDDIAKLLRLEYTREDV